MSTENDDILVSIEDNQVPILDATEINVDDVDVEEEVGETEPPAKTKKPMSRAERLSIAIIVLVSLSLIFNVISVIMLESLMNRETSSNGERGNISIELNLPNGLDGDIIAPGENYYNDNDNDNDDDYVYGWGDENDSYDDYNWFYDDEDSNEYENFWEDLDEAQSGTSSSDVREKLGNSRHEKNWLTDSK